MHEELERLRDEAVKEVEKSQSVRELEATHARYMGKKGVLTAILRSMGKLSEEERPIIGKTANEAREAVDRAARARKAELAAFDLEKKLASEPVDITLSGNKIPVGHQHPLYKLLDELLDIFLSLGFSVAEGPELEFSRYNFDMLNMPSDHPSRDSTETFYIGSGDEICLRPQTSPVQIREMLGRTPPIRIISPGKVYRKDEIDATHSPLFHQLEGLVVGEGISMADLKTTLDYVAKRIYGENTKTVFRPHQFYYTEPSAEMDATCFACGGKGCRICKGTGYIELLGCGMVHPAVLRGCGIDPEKYSGFAFGMGIDRMTMFKYEIRDMRLLFGNDTEFLSQF
ncbi:MAG: phenylalanine--tRNA ligase subunit alpha [Eubacteriaceae bacterium]|nr:phenylalanine--tRNA ligase subunit alpha [Eubacteriaceae bacterium]